MELSESSNIIKWPFQISHEQHHKKLCDNLFECLSEFALATLEIPNLPRLKDGSPDYQKISVTDFFMWFAQNANKPDHSHEE